MFKIPSALHNAIIKAQVPIYLHRRHVIVLIILFSCISRFDLRTPLITLIIIIHLSGRSVLVVVPLATNTVTQRMVYCFSVFYEYYYYNKIVSGVDLVCFSYFVSDFLIFLHLCLSSRYLRLFTTY
jgi:hypothetical protein